jgi:hypothetical protein
MNAGKVTVAVTEEVLAALRRAVELLQERAAETPYTTETQANHDAAVIQAYILDEIEEGGRG